MNKFLTAIKHKIHRFKLAITEPVYARNPRKRAENLYRSEHGRNINWDNPTEFIEKLRWLQFRTDSSTRTRLADKLSARNFVTQNGFEDTLVPILGQWNGSAEINFNLLPDSFVLKTSHGSGDVVIVQNKAKINIPAVRRHFNKALKRPYGRLKAETHYFDIPRSIYAEQILVNDSTFSCSMVDYKFYCCNGKPLLCVVCLNRRNMFTHDTERAVYDTDWNLHTEWLSESAKQASCNIPRPRSLNKMIEMCRVLSAEMPFVRIDLYETNGKCLFGEFTFSPEAYMRFPLSDSAFELLAENLTLPKPDKH